MNSHLYLCRNIRNVLLEKCTCCLLLFKMHVDWVSLHIIFRIWHHAPNGHLVFFKSCFLVILGTSCVLFERQILEGESLPVAVYHKSLEALFYQLIF